MRFVYWKPEDWYLTIEKRRDVIEEMGDDDLDFAGWDIRKALQLASKSNPSLHDWLATTEYYYRHESWFPEFRQLCLDYFDPNACFQHFHSMATTNFSAFANAKQLPFKKYFYVFRALLCAKYIQRHLRPAPCLFATLLDEFYPFGPVREELDKLLEMKKTGLETEKTKQNPLLHQEVNNLFQELSTSPTKRPKKSNDALDDFFRSIVRS